MEFISQHKWLIGIIKQPKPTYSWDAEKLFEGGSSAGELVRTFCDLSNHLSKLNSEIFWFAGCKLYPLVN